MLVLHRKVGEGILIGDAITVTVVRFRNGGVRLGIEAPKDVVVRRAELVDARKVLPFPTCPARKDHQVGADPIDPYDARKGR